MYHGATGNVRFDACGDLSALAAIWKFTEDGIEEVEYFSLEQVNDFMASLQE